MKLAKILPTAAGVIALTATVAFAQEDREREEDLFSRTVITVSQLKGAPAGTLAATPAVATDACYQVHIRRGETTHQVLIDAYTGKVITKHHVA
ncbi:MAG: PepSY domain-containing protein [Pseudomonadota bacterium]